MALNDLHSSLCPARLDRPPPLVSFFRAYSMFAQQFSPAPVIWAVFSEVRCNQDFLSKKPSVTLPSFFIGMRLQQGF